jgi:hypothetical protein
VLGWWGPQLDDCLEAASLPGIGRYGGVPVVVRMLLAAGNMVTAFILAALTIIFLALNYPAVISSSLRTARMVKDVITGSGLNPSYNVWLEFLLEERQLVFIGYTIIMRMILAILTYIGTMLWPRGTYRR